MNTETLWHITVLSNFARAYDKYTRRYSKEAIPESTFPDQFFLLREQELEAGLRKGARLLEKMALPGNRLLALKTVVHTGELRDNQRTGIGRYVERGHILLEGTAWVDESGALIPVPVEEVMAQSFQLLQPELKPFAALQPRTFSVLPIARGCQASCPFCFSEASASAEQDQARLNLERVRVLAGAARLRGAERFVITGGGEPGLVRHPLLCDLIRTGSQAVGKTVLITNGHHLARRDAPALSEALNDYHAAGLRVLSISRHHHEDAASSQLMSLETDVAAVAKAWAAGRAAWPGLRLRFICVLQKGGVDSLPLMEAYLDWAASLGVNEICFKELYVSTSIESVYHRHAANAWSHAHQVPLSLVMDCMDRHGLRESSRLPWGSPVFSGLWKGQPMQIAAYTEPSLLWERSQGIARSWNLMADGRCLVSLEDRHSEITPALCA